MKTARAVTWGGSAVMILASGVGVVLSDGLEDAVWPALVLICGCVGLSLLVRRPVPKPKPWDRKRLVQALVIAVPVFVLMAIFVVLPSIRQTEDPMLRGLGIGIAAVVLASLVLAVVLGRSEHRTATIAGSTDGTN